MPKMISRLALLMTLVLFCWGLSSPARVVQKSAPSPPKITLEQWREDLRYFAAELPKRHKNVYHSMSREQFDRAVNELNAAVPSLLDHQIIVKIAQITAMVGDGHTGVHVPLYFKKYPIQLYWFGNELRVVAAAGEYQKTLGTRLVGINELSTEEVLTRVRTCIPSAENENKWYVMGTSPAFINVPEVLQTLGVVRDLGPAPFKFQDDAGKEFDLEIAPVELQIVNGVPALNLKPVVTPPLSRQRPGERFWFTYLADTQTTYVNFRSYASLGENARKLFQFLNANPTKRLVIDLRQNDGGDFFEGRKHLIGPLKKLTAINQTGHLFVLIGRRTFSAAMVNAIDFRKATNAMLVGEPIGERPNSYSENDEMTLPNSRLVVSYSTRYYKFLDEDIPAVMPDHHIDPDWEQFKAGRDPVLEWILAQPLDK